MSSMPQTGPEGPERGSGPQGAAGDDQAAGQPVPGQPLPGQHATGQQVGGQPVAGEPAAGPQAAGPVAAGAAAQAPQWRPEWGTGPQDGGLGPVDDPTRVVGRRVVQYIIDIVLASIIPSILYFALDRGHGARLVIGALIAFVLSVVVYVWYWVLRPKRHMGQTFGMQMLGIAIVSKRGGPAGTGQLVGRWILLIVDDLFLGLVGLITMLVSRQHQRVGDHAAGTLVVRTGRR
ncbi:MAG: RDD family protein [Streptosporangiaceae bacterium]